VLAGNTLLRPMVNWINRRPITAAVTEAEYRVHVVCDPGAVSQVRDLLDVELDRGQYPVREVETLSDSDDQGRIGRDPRADHRRGRRTRCGCGRVGAIALGQVRDVERRSNIMISRPG